jgi:UDP-N-acetylmuramoyl-tripeptide--D-alanyl-D-alanine ligase
VLVRQDCAISEPGKAAVIRVEDTRIALGHLAARYRSDFDLPVVVVAGSNGKTTTKEILGTVLKQKVPTTWSEASFNNDIGVPLSLMRIESAHRAAVLEAGTNHPGELAPLVRMIAPRYAVITSLGREHLEHFRTIEGVAEEEGWAAELLPKEGKLFINGDTPLLKSVLNRTPAASVTVGMQEHCAWRVADIKAEIRATVFNLQTENKAYAGSYRVPLLGLHQALNAALAIAFAAEMGLTKAEIQAGLAECKPARMRLQLWEGQGIRLLDDSYNANADSMIAALQTLRAFPCSGRRVAVLGDMAELGEESESAHMEVGRCAAELGVGQLFAVGSMARQMARGARAAGLHRVIEFPGVEAAKSAVRSFVKPGDVVLVKASRVMRLEQISEFLKGLENSRGN